MSNKTLVILVVIIVMLVGGYFVFWQGPAPQEPLKKITIAEFGEVFLYAPLYVAEQKGFFREEGLEVTIVPAGGDEKVFAALLSGDAQFGVGDPTFVAISGEKGQPGVVVAGVLKGVPFWGVAKKPSIPKITKPSDLNGYRVATFPSPSTAYTLQAKMFQAGGLKPHIKEVAFGSLLAALETGEVDIALELEPTVSAAVKSGNRIVYGLSEYYPEFAITGLTALPSYVQANRDTTQKVVNAFQKAFRYIRTNPSEVAGLLVQRFPEVKGDIAENAVANMIRVGVFPENAVVAKSGWEVATQLRLDVGDLKTPAQFEKYVLTEFAENAKSVK